MTPETATQQPATPETEAAERLQPFEALAWRLRRAAQGVRPGAHRGARRGAGADFADIVDLMAHPDPRRIDVRRSVVDPGGAIRTRRFETPASLVVHVLADWSASLAAAAAADRRRMAETLVAGLAAAALRTGDRYALSAARGDDPAPLMLPPSRRAGLADWTLSALGAFKPGGVGLATLIAHAARTPRSGALVFVVSDFEVSPAELDALLSALEGRPAHFLWLLDSGFEVASGRPALTDVLDLETGRVETVLMRHWYAQAYARARARRHAALDATFTAHGRAPIRIADNIDVGLLAASLAGET